MKCRLFYIHVALNRMHFQQCPDFKRLADDLWKLKPDYSVTLYVHCVWLQLILFKVHMLQDSHLPLFQRKREGTAPFFKQTRPLVVTYESVGSKCWLHTQLLPWWSLNVLPSSPLIAFTHWALLSGSNGKTWTLKYGNFWLLLEQRGKLQSLTSATDRQTKVIHSTIFTVCQHLKTS